MPSYRNTVAYLANNPFTEEEIKLAARIFNKTVDDFHAAIARLHARQAKAVAITVPTIPPA